VTQASEHLDALAADLRELRHDAGSPSFAEIVVRVARLRTERGVAPAAARPGRTTVYDAFRDGRRRLDTELVLDIVRALGGDDDAVAAWEVRCRRAAAADPRPAPVDTLPDAPLDAPTDAPSPGETPVYGSEGEGRAPDPPRRPRSGSDLLLVVLGAIGLNLLGRLVVDALGLPLHLDMTGTATAAVLLGPWWGALVGALTNGLGSVLAGGLSWAFAPVNVAGALVWGYGVHRFGMARTIPRYFGLSLLAGVACTLVAVPIVLSVDAVTGHGTDDVISSAADVLGLFVVAVVSINLLISLADKVLAGAVALTVVECLPRERRPDVPWLGEISSRR